MKVHLINVYKTLMHYLKAENLLWRVFEYDVFFPVRRCCVIKVGLYFVFGKRGVTALKLVKAEQARL